MFNFCFNLNRFIIMLLIFSVCLLFIPSAYAFYDPGRPIGNMKTMDTQSEITENMNSLDITNSLDNNPFILPGNFTDEWPVGISDNILNMPVILASNKDKSAFYNPFNYTGVTVLKGPFIEKQV